MLSPFKGMLPARSDRGWKSALSATAFGRPCRIPAGCLRNTAENFSWFRRPPCAECRPSPRPFRGTEAGAGAAPQGRRRWTPEFGRTTGTFWAAPPRRMSPPPRNPSARPPPRQGSPTADVEGGGQDASTKPKRLPERWDPRLSPPDGRFRQCFKTCRPSQTRGRTRMLRLGAAHRHQRRRRCTEAAADVAEGISDITRHTDFNDDADVRAADFVRDLWPQQLSTAFRNARQFAKRQRLRPPRDLSEVSSSVSDRTFSHSSRSASVGALRTSPPATSFRPPAKSSPCPSRKSPDCRPSLSLRCDSVRPNSSSSPWRADTASTALSTLLSPAVCLRR